MSNRIKALEGIKKSSGTELGEEGIDLFISHHIDELPNNFWQKHLGTDSPSNDQVMDMLVLSSKWENMEIYDYTLPDKVTDYVVSVSFDDDNNIKEIVMES